VTDTSFSSTDTTASLAPAAEAPQGSDPSETSEESETQLLVQEGDIAADYLEGLLDILDYDGDIDMDVQNGRAIVAVTGSLQSLIGPKGTTLEALQDLTRLAIYRSTGVPSRLMLDVGGYREGRRKELGALAKNAAEKVRQHGEPVRLAPMTAFERKCVHDVINVMPGVVSESEGEDPERRVVVQPATDG
jgi:spoIIIJ-associated protein